MIAATGRGPDRLAIDEVGIAYGAIGGFLFKTGHRPIMARHGDVLVPVATCLSPIAQRAGRTIAIGMALAQLSDDDQSLAGAVARRAHIHNHDQIGAEGSKHDLLLDLQGLAAAELCAEVDALLAQADATGLARGRLVFDLSDAARASDRFDGLADHVCAAGAGFSLDLASASRIGPFGVARPRIVRIGAAWFKRIAGEPALARLLKPTLSALRRGGALGLVEGIDSEPELEAALAASADLMSGDLLGRLALAGTDVDETIRPLPGRVGGVVRLRG